MGIDRRDIDIFRQLAHRDLAATLLEKRKPTRGILFNLFEITSNLRIGYQTVTEGFRNFFFQFRITRLNKPGDLVAEIVFTIYFNGICCFKRWTKRMDSFMQERKDKVQHAGGCVNKDDARSLDLGVKRIVFDLLRKRGQDRTNLELIQKVHDLLKCGGRICVFKPHAFTHLQGHILCSSIRSNRCNKLQGRHIPIAKKTRKRLRQRVCRILRRFRMNSPSSLPMQRQNLFLPQQQRASSGVSSTEMLHICPSSSPRSTNR